MQGFVPKDCRLQDSGQKSMECTLGYYLLSYNFFQLFCSPEHVQVGVLADLQAAKDSGHQEVLKNLLFVG